jgi:phosphonopyruvate decarboxylase
VVSLIDSEKLLDFLYNQDLKYFVGVPDSLMSKLCWSLMNNSSDRRRDLKAEIVANEGIALAKAIGYNLATKKLGVVFLQNAGLGNIYNPFVSLSSLDVLNIPAIFLIGWRGEPKHKDEPQHEFQGRITKPTLDIMKLKTLDIRSDTPLDYIINSSFIQKAISKNESRALLFSKGSI